VVAVHVGATRLHQIPFDGLTGKGLALGQPAAERARLKVEIQGAPLATHRNLSFGRRRSSGRLGPEATRASHEGQETKKSAPEFLAGDGT
jgi:hypothetical protein